MRFLAWLMRASAARGARTLFVDLLLAKDLLDRGELVGGVVDDEVAGEPDAAGASRRRRRAQRAWNVEIHMPAGRAAEQRLDALAHLLGGLVGEGDGEDLAGIGEARSPTR